MTGGQWSPVSFNNCTVGAGVSGFAILWMTLTDSGVNYTQESLLGDVSSSNIM